VRSWRIRPGAYLIDEYELARGLPSRLTQQGKRDHAIALIEVLGEFYGDDPRYWPELADAYLRAGYQEKATTALAKAVEMNPDRTELAWVLENIDDIMPTVQIQLAAEGKYEPGESTGLRGPYLGQKPPGSKPEVFAPGLLNSMDHEYSITFSPDGREIYFSRSTIGTMVCRWREDGWTAPEVIYLIDEDHLTEEANVAPDNRKIFFCGRKGIREQREIYVADRVGDGWGPAKKLFVGMYATSALNGNLYYTEITGSPDYGVVVRRRPTAGGYGEPEVIGGGVNSPDPDAHPFIAPDESFLIFDTYREVGRGVNISFRNADGTFGEAIPLGEHLGIPPVGQPALSPDGKYLFFCLNGDMYWVDASSLMDLKPE